MEAKSFGDLESDGEDGIEGCGGFLKDVGDFSSPSLAEYGRRAGEEVGSILPQGLSADVAGWRGWGEAGESECGGCFS
jgi:hypothetical protein